VWFDFGAEAFDGVPFLMLFLWWRSPYSAVPAG